MPPSFSNMNGPPFISAKPSLIPYLSSLYGEITSISRISLVKKFKFWSPRINAPLCLEIQFLIPPSPPRHHGIISFCPGESWQILGAESERPWPSIFCIFTLYRGNMVYLKKIGCDFSCIFFFFLQNNTVSHHLFLWNVWCFAQARGLCQSFQFSKTNVIYTILYVKLYYYILKYTMYISSLSIISPKKSTPLKEKT